MTTPIRDFIRGYIESGAARLHMPGHKGESLVGYEAHDITEIPGADSLFEASGIIRESEENASSLFGCPTFYSAEGSSLAIRGMLYLLQISKSGRMKIAAGRNAHKVFISAAALLDFDIDWLHVNDDSYITCTLTPDTVEDYLYRTDVLPRAVYVTSPDYFGNILDIGGIADVCHRYGVMLLVDSAHGAYLRFLDKSAHPIDLGADMCAASAHKTMPVLTGGAYLHLSPSHTDLAERAKDAMMMFASTSPSYLILESLDAANAYLEGYSARLEKFLPTAARFKKKLSRMGFELVGDEPLKVTIMPKTMGYTGMDIAGILEDHGIFCEMCDPDHVVMMLTPETKDEWICRTLDVLSKLPKRTAICDAPPRLSIPDVRMSVREALMSPSVTVDVTDAAGRILSAVSVGCPPAVPIVVSGEIIDSNAVEVFRYYGIEKCTVVK